MKKISIIVPIYYNEESLPDLFIELEKLEKSLLKKKILLELIFVDDGSGDHSLQVLLKFKKKRPKTIIIKLTRNFGVFQAIKRGYEKVTGDAFMFLAADLQDPPSLILDMAEKWLAGSKLTICVRKNRGDSLRVRLASYIHYLLLRFLLLPNYPKTGFDLALMDKIFLPFMKQSSKDVYIHILAIWLGFKPEIIEYDRAKREKGKSRWTLYKKLNAFFDIFLGFSVFPIRLFFTFGLFVTISSFIYFVGSLISLPFREISFRSIPFLSMIILFFCGVLFLMLGLLGDLIWRIYNEVNKRPGSVVEKVYK